MISATEARELAKLSNAKVESILTQIEPIIRAAAEKNRHAVTLEVAGIPEMECVDSWRHPRQFTPIQQSVAKRLMDLGFRVEIEQYEYHRGGGLGNPDPAATAWGNRIKVAW